MTTLINRKGGQEDLVSGEAIIVEYGIFMKYLMKVTIVEILKETILLRNEDNALKPIFRMNISAFQKEYTFVEKAHNSN